MTIIRVRLLVVCLRVSILLKGFQQFVDSGPKTHCQSETRERSSDTVDLTTCGVWVLKDDQ